MAINFPIQKTIPAALGETEVKVHAVGSCNKADVANLPKTFAGGSSVFVVDAGEDDAPVRVYDENAQTWREW